MNAQVLVVKPVFAVAVVLVMMVLLVMERVNAILALPVPIVMSVRMVGVARSVISNVKAALLILVMAMEPAVR